MQPNEFPTEIKRLCSLICGDTSWLAWVHSRSEACFISANELRRCSIEERVLLKNLELSHPFGIFSLSEAHVLRNYIPPSGEHLLFLHGQLDETGILLAVPALQQFLLEKILLLIADRKEEWQLRRQLSGLIDYQQQQLQQAEERYRLLHRQREEQVKQLLVSWAAAKTPLQITFEETIFARFDFSLTDAQIRVQLENALRLARFIQPETNVYRLSAAHIQPVGQVETPTVNVPLNTNQRVELLLDKYEASARAAQQKGLAVNGKTIAGNLQPSISPPAITDALKKNRKAIGALLGQHPNRWLLLRKYLKPVKELNDRALYRD